MVSVLFIDPRILRASHRIGDICKGRHAPLCQCFCNCLLEEHRPPDVRLPTVESNV